MQLPVVCNMIYSEHFLYMYIHQEQIPVAIYAL